MRRFMCDAEIGAEQKGEDPTMNRLQEMVADLLGQDDEIAVEQLAHDDAVAGPGPGPVPGDLDPATADPHGVVTADHPGVAAPAEQVEILRRAAPDGGGLGRPGEALVEAGDEA
jgi:hypothetical protein